MRIVVAMDSFKGSISGMEAGEAVKEGILAAYPKAEVSVCPLADGGEGSTEAILSAKESFKRSVRVQNPLGEYIDAIYGVAGDTVVMEMSAAAGLTLITERERNPLLTTTYGVGEMIKDAVLSGYRKFIIGIGGSATNDGGAGMLSALGYKFLNKEGLPVSRGAAGLAKIASIDTRDVLTALGECSFTVACDVQNPLCGEADCSAVYGPQKGADVETVQIMDKAMAHFASLTKALYPKADDTLPGCGAAGGLGFAFLTYLNGTLQPGIDIVIEKTGLEQKIKNTDIVIVGEGKLDGQSAMGKAPMGVARVAKRYQKPVIALAGSIGADAELCNVAGIDAFFSIVKAPCSLSEAMEPKRAMQNLRDTAEQVFRLIQIKR